MSIKEEFYLKFSGEELISLLRITREALLEDETNDFLCDVKDENGLDNEDLDNLFNKINDTLSNRR
jgi:hypothetical protein